MENKIKLVSFDLDDTLINDIHSVMLLCILNNKYEELLDIEKRKFKGEDGWIEADIHKAKLLVGLEVSEVKKNFKRIMKPVKNIEFVVETLHKNGIQSIVITAGPVQVAQAVKELYGFDDFYGSNYEDVDGVFTGRLLNHLGKAGKVSCLFDYCEKANISPSECIAVGDGFTDIPIFEVCAKSIALNYSPAVKGKATHYIKTQDLSDVLKFII